MKSLATHCKSLAFTINEIGAAARFWLKERYLHLYKLTYILNPSFWLKWKTSLEATAVLQVRGEGALNMSGPSGDSGSVETHLPWVIFCRSKQHIFLT